MNSNNFSILTEMKILDGLFLTLSQENGKNKKSNKLFLKSINRCIKYLEMNEIEFFDENTGKHLNVDYLRSQRNIVKNLKQSNLV